MASEHDTVPSNLGKISAIVVCGLLAFLALVSILEQLGIPSRTLLWVHAAFVLALFAIVGWASRTNEAQSFFVAHRNVPDVANGLAVATAWVPAGSFLALAGLLYTYGYDATAFLVGSAAGLVLHGVLVAPYLARSGTATIAAFLGLRFGTPVRALASMIVAGASFTVLVVALSAGAALAATSLQVPFLWCLVTGVVALLACAVPGGMHSLTWTALAQGIVMLVAFLATIVLVSVTATGTVVPHVGYGEIVQAVTDLERTMIEKGFADARTLKPHVKPYLQIDALNYFAMVLGLMAGTAALPQLAGRAVTSRTGQGARSSTAWALAFSFLLLVTAPIYAAFAKFEVYSVVAAGTKLAELPSWMESLSRQDLMRVHGLSMPLLEDVRTAVETGSSDAVGVASYLKANAATSHAAWLGLKPPVQGHVLDAARAAIGATEPATWDTFRTKLLPAAATAAGVKSDALTLSALEITPEALVLKVPEIAGLPVTISTLLVVGALSGLLAIAAASLVAAGGTLGHDILVLKSAANRPGRANVLVSRSVMVVLASAAAGLGLIGAGNALFFVLAALTVIASALFPVLVLSIWWKRTTAAGVMAGMLVGLSISLYYVVATQYAPVAFHELWAQASRAAPAALKKFADLQSAWVSAQGEAKDGALAALQAHARGSVLAPGVANWFGLNISAIPVVSMPLAILAVGLVSLVTRPPQSLDALSAIRRPP